jgi:hypothetical protein
LNAYKRPSSEPTYTTPFATVGEDVTDAPVVATHDGAQGTVGAHTQRFASNAYSRPSPDPTYTMPFTTVGDDATGPPVAPRHRGAHPNRSQPRPAFASKA